MARLELLFFLGIVAVGVSLPRSLPLGNVTNSWAFLVATSYDWYNYRHQADVCHAYQVLRQHGMPADRIIVMMFDDIANHTDNPTPGVIINEPNGTNVYEGVQVDYSREDVTVKNFLNVLQGNKDALVGIGSGRVIESNSTSDIFLLIVDHGEMGSIAFPHIVEPKLTAEVLSSTIQRMYNAKQYRQVVIYVDTCFAGSMFENLPKNINAYAVTATNATYSSYACYYDDQRMTFLSDCFDIAWIRYLEKANTSQQTLEMLYKVAKNETTRSTVCEYGDLNIGNETLGGFMGTVNTKRVDLVPQAKPRPHDAVSSEDVSIAILARRIFDGDDVWLKEKHEEELIEELKVRKTIRQAIRTVVQKVSNDERLLDKLLYSKSTPLNLGCIKEIAEIFYTKCFRNIKPFQMTYVTQLMVSLGDLCEAYDITTVLSAIDETCDH